LDAQLLQLGLATPEELGAGTSPEEEQDEAPRHRSSWDEAPVRPLKLADKLLRLFQHDFSAVHDIRVFPVWAAGEVLEFGGDFNKYVTSKRLQKQEGVIFRHLLRLILLCGEFAQIVPPDADASQWREELEEIAARLTDTCRRVDATSTDKALESAEL
jgi:hypothetical protein